MTEEITPPVLVASRNVHKVREIGRLLSDLPLQFLSPDDLGLKEAEEEDELEPFGSFALNAMSKAKYFHSRSGLPTIADDSGLCVDALGGAPDVRTKRFAPSDWVEKYGLDEANNRWLLHALEGVPVVERGAHYRCVIALSDDIEHAVFEGRVEGRIARTPRGDNGFGYDPLFVLEDRDETYGELPDFVKQATSHRFVAINATRPWLEERVCRPSLS